MCKTSICVAVLAFAIGGCIAPGMAKFTPAAIAMIGRVLGRRLVARKLVAGGGVARALSGSLRPKPSSF